VSLNLSSQPLTKNKIVME